MKRVFLLFQQGHFPSFDDPASLGQHRSSIHRPGDDVQNLAVRQTKVTSDIAALLLAVGNPESTDFLIRRSEMCVEIVAHLPIGQRVPTERLRVVSGEIGIFKIAGYMEKKS